ncbi:hypothetical protein KPH14_001151 [Odynerus spinipes]|uniref:U-box domain-containing protein n=1 Tax=Odynerus spinipes TaxID=1348599 RepID=A0AAD9VRY2_9HYME|nr:hypothetical protein KPH14_001151 [Odynerus spinipes]
MLRAVSKDKENVIMNFCAPCLQPTVKCDTISTEGYDITNLIQDPCNGFLAYSCIKPPVQIDFTFICNIQIHHIFIWPSVSSQKSSGFQMYAKTCDSENIPYTLLSSGCLNPSDTGVLFYAANVNPTNISIPSNFLKRYIKGSTQDIASHTKHLRICIFKTQNSVPALGKIEVWGFVSPRCSKDIRANIHALWSASQVPMCSNIKKHQSNFSPTEIKKADTEHINETETSLEIPDSFLDAITWEIMTQPITLPSGKVIDQTTLQKHAESEALWGRSLSDPFTGLPFNENRKPIIATALKLRIDKFLLENSNMDEIKRLPRVLVKIDTNSTCKVEVHTKADNTIQRKGQCHQLPITLVHSRRAVPYTKKVRTSNLNTPINCDNNKEKNNEKEVHENSVNSDTDADIQVALSHLKRFSTPKSLQPYTTKSANNN